MSAGRRAVERDRAASEATAAVCRRRKSVSAGLAGVLDGSAAHVRLEFPERSCERFRPHADQSVAHEHAVKCQGQPVYRPGSDECVFLRGDVGRADGVILSGSGDDGPDALVLDPHHQATVLLAQRRWRRRLILDVDQSASYQFEPLAKRSR